MQRCLFPIDKENRVSSIPNESSNIPGHGPSLDDAEFVHPERSFRLFADDIMRPDFRLPPRGKPLIAIPNGDARVQQAAGYGDSIGVILAEDSARIGHSTRQTQVRGCFAFDCRNQRRAARSCAAPRTFTAPSTFTASASSYERTTRRCLLRWSRSCNISDAGGRRR